MPPKRAAAAKGKGKARAVSSDDDELDEDLPSDGSDFSDAPAAKKAKKWGGKAGAGGGKRGAAGTTTLVARLTRKDLEELVLKSVLADAPLTRKDVEGFLEPGKARGCGGISAVSASSGC